ncbi:probable multidrug resistance-associated protein lethal(2)03659 isoform X2 [Sitophilus oryzae]|uniref:Probable multidrug resistance-associated protein lethal(2)03659 isoform X2 n=1 Tax=Sitophilus oryzae TaxID=7048 RepID=A0A6J2YMT4_SITOR|nr:probable multidrug resistance-associated protein lethal(2)03659 isoform X2 [Sitophilus oryzae]
MDGFKDGTDKKPIKKHPFLEAGIFSKIFFIWMLPLFVKGLKKDLLEEDIYPSLKSHDSKLLGDKIEKYWKTELKNNRKNPSLWKCLLKVFGKELSILGICYLFNEICARLAQPLIISQLLRYYEPNSTMTKREAYCYAGGVALSSFVASAFIHSFMLRTLHLGAKIRVATSALIYRKALKLNKSSLADTTVGQMVNLLSNDVGRFEVMTIHIHHLWIAPLETVIVLILIYYYVGVSGIPGVIFMLCFIPLQMWLGKKTSEFRLATAIRTDERIRLMNEIISGIQVIKMYTWEKPFAKLVEISRRKEMQQIKNISIIRAIMMSFNLFVNRAAVYVCILAYVFTGNILDAQYVFVVTSFYSVLKFSVTMFFPQGVTQFAEANISVKRITRFLLYDEINFDSSSSFFNAFQSSNSLKAIANGNESNKPIGIRFKNASVKWIKSTEENTLENLYVDVQPGKLAAVIGPVGSGKTTLLHAILGELEPLDGIIDVNGPISYASQEPWLFVGSVRQNILFGQKFNIDRYYKVVKACALERDFTLFPHGDHTIVGERGVSLSGGQRARINLARAVYKEAEIYLLDDPLSAVDAHVGKQLFDDCITGYLKNKCVVLVTHQLQYLKNVSNIYLLGNKTVEHSGTYDDIQNSGKSFTQLLSELQNIIDEEETDDTKSDEDVKPLRRRRISTKEVVPRNENNPELEKESRGSGKISWEVYKSYFVSGGHWCKILTLFIIFVIAQAIGSSCDYFLTIWVNMNQIQKTVNETYPEKINSSILQHNNSFPLNVDLYNDSDVSLFNASEFSYTPFHQFWFTYMDETVLPVTYSVAIFIVISLTIFRSLVFYRFCNKASVRMHNNMFYKIVYATMRFFNVNPSGRILNRFSKDMNQVDENLPMTLLDTLQISLTVLAITTVIAIVNPWMLLPTVIMLTIFYYMRVGFLATSRDIKRLEGITRSPVYSHLTASLQGLTTIRAFGAQEILKSEFDSYQNSYSSAYFMFLGANRTFGFWLDMHCVLFITLVTFSFLFFDTENFGGNVGLAITQALNLTGMFQWGMRQWSELENTMTCVERIKEYADVVPEPDCNTKDPPKGWPAKGDVKFENLSLRYVANEPYVLKELNFSIKSTEKVGVVGRTGAGKSSIIMALFRLAINEGRIIIDNMNTADISLNRLRSSISIIPQEPVLFSGTLRKNLDPFDEYDDASLWSALEEVELKAVVDELPLGLESKMSEGGSNFSVGQRQLVCLARAIVRKNKILVLDEATANVDPQTDALIQTTIREKFSNCTVLTIAHRLHTIMDSDKVIVMDAGKVVEFGHPHELLQKKGDGVFYELVQQTGRAMAENLISIAEESYKAVNEKEHNKDV